MMADVSKSPGSKKFLCAAIALNLLICYVRCHAGPFPETVDIAGEHTLTRLRRAAGEDSKEHYILKISDKEVSLSLKKTSTVNANVPVFVIRNGIPAEIKTDRIENLDFYQDKRHGASLSVRRMREQNVSLVEGTLTIGGREYHLQSAAQRHSREAPHRQSSDDKHIDGALYSLTKIQRQSDYIDDTVGRSPTKLRKHVPYARQRRDTSSKARYGVELMMVVDNAIYTRWYNTTTGHEDRQKAAIEKIRYYFAHVANGVDLRYQSMDEAPFEIYVRLVGLCIATDPMSSIWTESTDIKSDATPRPLVNAKLALKNFTDWINEDSTRNTLPTFDHTMLFTGYDIWNGEDASGNKAVSVAGVAKVGQICKQDRTSINEDHGGFACIGVSSHEMGHNLGAVHDGDNNTCNGSEQYIMAAVSDGNAPLSALRNAFTFSKCSVEAFRQKISELNSEENNCLNNTAKPENETSWKDYMKTFPGQKYPPNAQCRQLYGPQSYYCGGEKADSEICARMSCYSPVDGTCIQGGGIHAARGTTCGNNKWCESGSCELNELAPEAKDICQHGDRRGTVFINDTRTCRDFQTARVTWHCYSQVARGYCCDSCSDVYNASDTGCLYGDKAPFCVNITRRQCYGKTTQNEPVPDVCCRKCREFRGNINGCLYGDKAPFCINITRRQCYDKTTQNEPVPDVCCRKCREFRGNINGCPYGDRAQNCRKEQCSNSKNIINCCETCASPDSTTETTPEQQLPVVFALPLEIKINAPFHTRLTDSNTREFKKMSNSTCYPIVEELDSAYSQDLYIRCKVLSFRKGSVIADARVDFSKKSSNTDLPPLTDIKDNINNTFQTNHIQLVKLDLMFDECHSPDIRVTCSRYADCEDQAVGYSCHCIPGYRNTSNGGDSCAESCEKAPCKNDGKCMENQDGPVSCQCAEGFEGPRCERVLVPTWHEPVIIGGVCGGLVVIILLLFVCISCVNRKRQPEQHRSSSGYDNRVYAR